MILTDRWTKIAREVSFIESALNKWLESSFSIGLTEFRAALLISKSPDQELRITELAQQLGLNQSSATRLVERMERKELAFRDVCPDDGRGIYAALTQQGLEKAATIAEPFDNKLRSLIGDIQPDWLDPHLVLRNSDNGD
nr:transcriptional regulator [Streptococcus thermophilus]